MKKTNVTRQSPHNGRRIDKMVITETKIIDSKKGMAQCVVSSESEDRDGDTIVQKGWVLDYFQKHPILLSSHNYGSLMNQIGEWEDMSVKGKQLVGIARYYVGEGNHEADWGFNLASKGRAAYSVGFIPLEWEERGEEGNTNRPAGKWGYKFTEQELLEVSHVTVPSNPDALQLMAKAGGVQPELRDMARDILSKINEDGLYSEEGAKKLLEHMEKKDMNLCACYAPDCGNMAAVYIPLCPDHLLDALMLLQAHDEVEEDTEEEADAQAVSAVGGKSAYIVRTQKEETNESAELVALDIRAEIKLAVKELFEEMGLSLIKGATSYSNLPLSDREKEWTASSAKKSVAKWASSDGSGDKDTVDWAKYAKAFFWFDSENKEAFGGYKLPFAEVVDGKLVANWNGVHAAAGAVGGARGNKVNIPDGDVSAVKAHIAKYYAEAADEYDDDSIIPPWKDDDGTEGDESQASVGDVVETKDTTDVETKDLSEESTADGGALVPEEEVVDDEEDKVVDEKSMMDELLKESLKQIMAQ